MTNQKINIILAVVGMIESPRIWNRLNIDNYVEIYIKSKIENIVNLNKKKIYHRKKIGKIIGIDIKPEYPTNPDITIINSFKSSSDKLSKMLMRKINILLNKKPYNKNQHRQN